MSSIILTKRVRLLKDNHCVNRSTIFPKQQTSQATILRKTLPCFSQVTFACFFLFWGEGVTLMFPKGANCHTQIRIIQGVFNNNVVYKYVGRT